MPLGAIDGHGALRGIQPGSFKEFDNIESSLSSQSRNHRPVEASCNDGFANHELRNPTQLFGPCGGVAEVDCFSIYANTQIEPMPVTSCSATRAEFQMLDLEEWMPLHPELILELGPVCLPLRRAEIKLRTGDRMYDRLFRVCSMSKSFKLSYAIVD